MLFLSGACFAFAGYFLLAFAFRVPTARASGSITGRVRKKDPRDWLEEKLEFFARPLARLIPLDITREVRLSRMLRSAHSTLSPRQFAAKLAIKFLLFAVLALFLWFVHPLLSLGGLGAAILFVKADYEREADAARELRDEISRELPGFIASFSGGLAMTHDVISILESYRSNYEDALSRELALTVKDMRSGSPELALQRMDLRLNLPVLSEFVRGVLAMLRGEDMSVYFANLQVKITTLWEQEQEKRVLGLKPKISRMSFGILIFALVSLFVFMGLLLARLGGELL